MNVLYIHRLAERMAQTQNAFNFLDLNLQTSRQKRGSRGALTKFAKSVTKNGDRILPLEMIRVITVALLQNKVC